MSASSGSITDVTGIKIGQFTDTRRPTGCTVVLVEAGAVAGVDVRGGAPGTRETDLLHPINLVQQVHAVVLSGGSAFGLNAASGVVQYLEERGIGFDTRLPNVPKVPIVPAAILFDLQLGDPSIRPTDESGYIACQSATRGPVAQGNVGAGAGATVGKVLGLNRAMKAGVGTASIRLADDVVIGALVAVNAWGQVSDPATGRLLAGVRSSDGRHLINIVEQIKSGARVETVTEGQNTTIGVVATNATLSKPQATVVAQMAHDGLARAINPIHSPLDGDTIFALATGHHAGPVNVALIGAMAAEVMAQAVVQAIVHAEGLPGLPSYKDIFSCDSGK